MRSCVDYGTLNKRLRSTHITNRRTSGSRKDRGSVRSRSPKKPKVIDLMVDSDIFHRDLLRRTEGFRTLARLADADRLRIHVPYVVQEEHEAHLREAVSKALKG